MGLIAWLSEIAVQRPLAWICCLLFCCTVFLTSCGGSGSNLPTAQIQPQSETIQTPVPRPQTSGTPIPQPAGSPQIVAQPTSDPAAVGNASPQPQPSQSPEIPASSPTANPGSSPSPGALPSPSGSPPAPAPSRTPRPFPTSTLNPGEIPVGAVVITNAAEQDGVPLTLGQEIVLSAVAGNDQGRDISNQIQWFNQAGELIGRGPTLTYRADQVVMETITAQVRSVAGLDSRSGTSLLTDPGKASRVSFTVSPEDVQVARRVKVLPDEVQQDVLALDLLAGNLDLRDSSLLPTVYEGDVVLGALGAVPPLRILKAAAGEGILSFQVERALPRDVIESGAFSFQTDPADLGAKAEGIDLINIPTTPTIPDVEPQDNRFKVAGEPVPLGLKVTESSSLEWQPQYEGIIAFDKMVGNGLSQFALTSSAPFSANFRVELEGAYQWKNREGQSFDFLTPKVQTILVSIGPIPLPIMIIERGIMVLAPDLEVVKFAGFEAAYTEGQLQETVTFNQEQGWVHQGQLNGGQWTGKIDENSNMSGVLGVALHPDVVISLFEQEAPGAGISLYATAVGQHQDVEIDDSGSTGTQLLGTVSGRSWLNLAGKVTYLTTENNIPFSLDTSSAPNSEGLSSTSLQVETETKSPTRIIIETTVTAGAFLGVAAVATPVAPVVGTIIVTAFALAGGIGIVFYATPVNLDEVDSLPGPGDPLPIPDPTDPQVIDEILDSLLEPEADPGGGQCTPPPTPPVGECDPDSIAELENEDPKARDSYEEIRNLTDDIQRISENTGIPEDVIGQVREHIFFNVYTRPVLVDGSIQAITGRFSAIGEVASLWLSAVNGSLTGQNLQEFTRFIAHEYIESQLIENGIDFRSFDPEYYNDSLECFLATPNAFGAHDLSRVSASQTLLTARF